MFRAGSAVIPAPLRHILPETAARASGPAAHSGRARCSAVTDQRKTAGPVCQCRMESSTQCCLARQGAVVAVEWERVGQLGFDRIVEAVVHRVYEVSARVEVVNGRGGDDGIDIKVVDGSRVRVFQLKYYPDGFPTGSFKGRRKSIRESFARAMRQGPQEWVLVVPCVLTAAEREFVLSLGAGQTVQVEVWDRAKLDDLLSVHADVEASFTRNQLLEAARVYGQERALLMDGIGDVSARVTALGGQVDRLDDHWTVDFAREGDMVVHMLRGKHPRAHEVSPIVITLTGIGPLAPEQAEAVRRSLGYGLDEKVVLPRGAVEKMTVTGPWFLAREHQDVEVRWHPAQATLPAGMDAELVFLDGERVTASYSGTLKHLGRGSTGRSVRVELAGGRLQLLQPDNPQVAASLKFTFSLEGLEPAAALRVLRIHRRIAAGGAFEVRTGEGAVGGVEVPPSPGRGAPGGRTATALSQGPGGGAASLRAVLRHARRVHTGRTDLPAHRASPR